MTLALAIWAAIQRIGASALSFLGRLSLSQILCIILGCALVLALWRADHWKHVATERQAQLTREIAARKADRDAYAKAQADAAAKNKAQVQHVEQQYQRNSDNERQAYLDDLAKLRAGRVRSQAPAAPGSAGPANPSADDATAPRIDDAGVCVPATSDVCEAGAEIELRLMHLQNLFEQQTTINPNTEAAH
jgi:hypothetical protein